MTSHGSHPPKQTLSTLCQGRVDKSPAVPWFLVGDAASCVFILKIKVFNTSFHHLTTSWCSNTQSTHMSPDLPAPPVLRLQLQTFYEVTFWNILSIHSSIFFSFFHFLFGKTNRFLISRRWPTSHQSPGVVQQNKKQEMFHLLLFKLIHTFLAAAFFNWK